MSCGFVHYLHLDLRCTELGSHGPWFLSYSSPALAGPSPVLSISVNQLSPATQEPEWDIYRACAAPPAQPSVASLRDLCELFSYFFQKQFCHIYTFLNGWPGYGFLPDSPLEIPEFSVVHLI